MRTAAADLKFDPPPECPRCEGLGREGPKWRRCRRCKGTGSLPRPTVRPIIAGVAGLLAGMVLAGGVAVADPSIVTDVRTGIVQAWGGAAFAVDNGSSATPNDRSLRNSFMKLDRTVTEQELRELYRCMTEESANGFPGNSYCPDVTP